MTATNEIVVAGHICLDLIPSITTEKESLAELLKPGTLVNVGPAVVSTGGCVANTGVALHKLGETVRLVGKTGNDAFGESILRILRDVDANLTKNMVVESEGHSSYTAVISAPGIDRVFLHHPGANNTFTADDVKDAHLDGASLFHFGYPPIMRNMYTNDGSELEKLMRRVKENGLVTSLDMSMPDPSSEAGQIDWPALLSKVLPHVDVFLPSIDEIAFMLGVKAEVTKENISEIAKRLLDMGAAIVVLKLGSEGLYVRTSEKADRLECIKTVGGDPAAWADKEVFSACFRTTVAGTTGSGDCTVAGFLAELAHGKTPQQAAEFATAVGAFSVEVPEATGGIKHRSEVEQRLSRGWDRLDSTLV